MSASETPQGPPGICGSGRGWVHCLREPTEPHTCPFRVEINDDSETLCTCCKECEDECAQDI